MHDDKYNEEEAARRRDEVIRKMANTPPQHRTNRPKKAKATAVARKPAKRGGARSKP